MDFITPSRDCIFERKSGLAICKHFSCSHFDEHFIIHILLQKKLGSKKNLAITQNMVMAIATNY